MLSFFNRSPRCSVSLWKPWSKWGKTHCPLPSMKQKKCRRNKEFTAKPSATGEMVRPSIQFSNPEYGLFPLSPRESNLDVYVCVSNNTLHTTDSYLLHGDPPAMMRQPRNAQWHQYNHQSCLTACAGSAIGCLHHHQCLPVTMCHKPLGASHC